MNAAIIQAGLSVKNFIGKLVSNKWFWILLIILVLLIIIRKNWYKIKFWLGISIPEVDVDMDKDGKIDQISEQKKSELKNLSEKLYTSFLNENWTTVLNGDDRVSVLRQIIPLNDLETIYLARYYKNVNKTSIYEDLKSETTLPFIGNEFLNLSQNLLIKLKRIGEI